MANFKNKQFESKVQLLLSEIISQEVDDELIKETIVDEVKMSRDHSVAKVYVTFIEFPDESLQVLNNAAPFIRVQLAKKLTTKITPKLIFVIDTLLEEINEVEAIIKKANE